VTKLSGTLGMSKAFEMGTGVNRIFIGIVFLSIACFPASAATLTYTIDGTILSTHSTNDLEGDFGPVDTSLVGATWQLSFTVLADTATITEPDTISHLIDATRGPEHTPTPNNPFSDIAFTVNGSSLPGELLTMPNGSYSLKY
jgi:hypothetical protein